EFVRGEGTRLWDAEGNEYLDFLTAIAVVTLGHSHPHWVEAVTEQAARLAHVGNLFYTEPSMTLARRLSESSLGGKVFFANSGAEANECAIKIARKYHAANGAPERYRMITFEGAFHGRTLATLAATGQKKYLDGFGPVVEGFDQVPLGDVDAVKKAIGPETAAILIEPLQAEGGIRNVAPQFLKTLRQLCDQHGLLLICDEVQTGIGRSGEIFAYQRAGITPDIMTLAKGIGGGFPFGACLATTEAAKGMTPGTHGSTFAGNQLAMAAGNAVLDVVLAPGFLDKVRRTSLLLKQRLAEIKDRHAGVIEEVRGEGMLIGMRAAVPNGQLVDALRAEKLLTVAAGENVVRLLPPLIVGEEEIDQAVDMIDRACTRIERAQAA
ncbi:MAG: aspartate aminotransferase family protein, partial [Bradyrhizobiaceae bacterium]|nr:aspartate aminotransferase family protein [Bradyrhizobiaceae bacterium]